MNKFYIFLLSFMFLFVNCATTNEKAKTNPFKQYYESFYAPQTSISPYDSTHSKTPKLYEGNFNSAVQNIKTLERANYIVMGTSDFNGGKVDKEEAVVFGKELGADYVLFYSSYTNTISGTLPVTLPSTKTETTQKTGNVTDYGNIYGTDGSASLSGNTSYSETSTKATQEKKTTYFPYSVDRYNYAAVYFIGNPNPIILGVIFNNLSPDIKKRIGSNKGVIVTTVINGTPAFMTDILEGDIIRKANSIEIIDAGSLHSFLDLYEGERVKFEIIRDDKTIIKEVQLNESK